MKSEPQRRKTSLYWLLTTIKIFKNWPTIYWRKIRRPGSPTRLKLRNGLIFSVECLDQNIPTIAEVFEDKVYGNVETLDRAADPVIIDIGANIGSFAFYALQKEPRAKIYAFEPERNNFKALRDSIALNKFSQVVPINKAVAASDGTRTLLINDKESGKNSFFHNKGWQFKEEVSCTTLDRIFSDYAIDHCSLLKVDCEGAEYEIFESASDETLAHIDSIILEWHPVADKSVTDIESRLAKAHMKVVFDREHSILRATR